MSLRQESGRVSIGTLTIRMISETWGKRRRIKRSPFVPS
jgi:hypothetical protein